MYNSLLIADSGGTKTDWCFVDSLGERNYFTTKSYHPAQFSDVFWEEMNIFWQSQNFPKNTEVHFYGAACSLKDNQEIIKRHFEALGFTIVNVDSDLVGTSRALLGDESGIVGILGTGSVLAEFDGKQITSIFGGFGYLIGDEGSGYNFGKILIHQYLNGELSQALATEFQRTYGDRSAVLKNVYASTGKTWLSNLASQFRESEEIENLHRKNIKSFVDLYLSTRKFNSNRIYFSGSYAYYNQIILQEILQANGFQLSGCISNPISKLTDYAIKATV